jgi:hypothetical protein
VELQSPYGVHLESMGKGKVHDLRILFLFPDVANFYSTGICRNDRNLAGIGGALIRPPP